jgi:hypothetical protein
MTYAADVQLYLAHRGLVITQDQINEALDILEPRGLRGADAETALLVFLVRLSVYGKWQHGEVTFDEPVPDVIFPGWEAIRAEFAAEEAETVEQRNMRLFTRFGSDAVRVAACVSA